MCLHKKAGGHSQYPPAVHYPKLLILRFWKPEELFVLRVDDFAVSANIAAKYILFGALLLRVFEDTI